MYIYVRVRLRTSIANERFQGTGNKEKIEIKNDANRLTPEEVERMIKDAEDFAEEDKKVAERAVAKVCNIILSFMTSVTAGKWYNLYRIKSLYPRN